MLLLLVIYFLTIFFLLTFLFSKYDIDFSLPISKIVVLVEAVLVVRFLILVFPSYSFVLPSSRFIDKFYSVSLYAEVYKRKLFKNFSFFVWLSDLFFCFCFFFLSKRGIIPFDINATQNWLTYIILGKLMWWYFFLANIAIKRIMYWLTILQSNFLIFANFTCNGNNDKTYHES